MKVWCLLEGHSAALPAGYMRALALQVQCRRNYKVESLEQSMNSPWFGGLDKVEDRKRRVG